MLSAPIVLPGSRCVNQERAQLREHPRRVLEDVAPRVAAIRVLSCVRLPLALVALLPRVARVVELVAVELDGDSVVRPAAVDSPAAHHLVCDGQRKVVSLEEPQEAALELAEGD